MTKTSYTLSKFFAFIAGAAVGSAVTWKLLKTRYERIAQEEIDSVKEVFSKHFTPTEVDAVEEKVVPVEVEPEEPSPVSVREYAAELAKNGYTNYSDIPVEKKIVPVVNEGGPYVISPEEFGNQDDYETVSLTYYSDGVVADDLNYRIEAVDDVIGIDSLSHFGEYEDDSVFVRNDNMKTDYEILLSSQRYEDVAHSGPRSVED